MVAYPNMALEEGDASVIFANGNSSFDTVRKVAKALGLKFDIAAVSYRERMLLLSPQLLQLRFLVCIKLSNCTRARDGYEIAKLVNVDRRLNKTD